MALWSVVVGNIGTVYDGTDTKAARAAFVEYREQSATGYGRAAGESVLLMVDGEPFLEHEGEVTQ